MGHNIHTHSCEERKRSRVKQSKTLELGWLLSKLIIEHSEEKRLSATFLSILVTESSKKFSKQNEDTASNLNPKESLLILIHLDLIKSEIRILPEVYID